MTVPAALAAPWVLGTAAPVALPVALARDAADGDGRLWRSRAHAMALAYAGAEAGGVLASDALGPAVAHGGEGRPRVGAVPRHRGPPAPQRVRRPVAGRRRGGPPDPGARQRGAGTPQRGGDLARGTYPSSAARERALARLPERQPRYRERADGLRHLLPPRPGCTLALLEAAPQADVAILGHVGLEQLSSMVRLARSLPLRHPVRAELWRVPRAEVPTRRAAQVDGLWERWEALDAWVDGALAARDEVPPPANIGAHP